MAPTTQTIGPLPLKSSFLDAIFCSEIASVIIGFFIFYLVQTKFLSRWGPTARKAVSKKDELHEKNCDSPDISPTQSPIIPASVPDPTLVPITTADEGIDCEQKAQRSTSFFADRHQHRQSHIQNFRPKGAHAIHGNFTVSSTDIKSVSNNTHRTSSFFADRQQQRQGHIQNFRPTAMSHHTNLGPTGPPPGLESTSETSSPNQGDASERPPRLALGHRVERRVPTAPAASSKDPLVESLGCTGINRDEEALLQLWTDVMSMPKGEGSITPPACRSSKTKTISAKARPNDRKRL